MRKNISKKSISKTFSNVVGFSIISNILLLILGVVCILNPSFLTNSIGFLVGALLLVYAASLIYSFLTREGAKIYSLNLVFGILIALLGIVLIIYPYKLMSFVVKCVALYLLLSSFVKVNYAIWLKKANEETWIFRLTSAVMLIILALMMLFADFAALAFAQVIGAFLLAVSLINIANSMLFKKRSKEIIKIFW